MCQNTCYCPSMLFPFQNGIWKGKSCGRCGQRHWCKIVWPQSRAIRFSSCCPSYGGVHFIVCLLYRDSIAHSLLNGLERLWKFVSFLCKKGLNLTINTRFVVRVLFFRTYPILNQFVSDMMKCWIMFTAPWFTINVLFVPFMIQL